VTGDAGSRFIDSRAPFVEDGVGLPEPVRWVCRGTLSRGDVTEIEQLLLRLSSPETDAAEAAMARLAVLGFRAVEPMLARYRVADTPARLRILRLLQRTSDARALDLLVLVASHDSPPCRQLAVRALGSLRHKGARTALTAAFRSEGDSEVRVEIATSLARLAAGEAPELLDPVLGILFDTSESPAVRRAAFAALAGLRPADLRRVLRQLADTPDDPLAAEARSIMEGDGPETLTSLASTLVPSRDSRFPGSGLRLMQMGLRAVPSVLRTLESHGSDPETARRCVWTLGGMGPEALRQLVDRIDASWPAPVLADALDAFRGVSDRRTLGSLKELARRLGERSGREPDPEKGRSVAALRARVHRLIAAAGTRLAVADLKEALRQDRPPSQDLVIALGEIGRAEDLLDLLAAHVEADTWVREEIGRSVVRICRRDGKRRVRQVASRLSPERADLLRHLESGGRGSPGRAPGGPPAREKTG
jgi:HEAT repeat protein